MIARDITTLVGALALVAGLALPVAAEDPAPTLTDPERWKERAPDTFRAKFECSNGTFVIEVTRELSTNGADRFYSLVKAGFYDSTRFFRVMPDFIVQFGLHGDPEVSRAWSRARFPDDPVTGSNTAGTISFATPGPHSRTTQVFINLVDNESLDHQGFSPFGRVVEGMDVVTGIHASYGDRPSQGLIRQQGNAYLQREFPELDFVVKATIVGEEPTRAAPSAR